VEELTIVLNTEASTLEVGVLADVDRVLVRVLPGLLWSSNGEAKESREADDGDSGELPRE